MNAFRDIEFIGMQIDGAYNRELSVPLIYFL